jgi:hypothetical protein
MNERSEAPYKALSLGLALVFAAVGVIFLVLPRETLGFFNGISRHWGMIEGPAERSFFGVLAAAYMYVVTVLAWLMYRFPREKAYPMLLANAKFASSALSFLLFAVHVPWLIYLVNGILDAGLGFVALLMAARAKAGR